ncbi:hypothetical protein [Actinomadura oligospora]|uniref:hypothetical protein n=1 Tax=Actinomadura oligospora TaxID=111804 RepID=UPI0004B7D868|nr:hypothetical protein [Actinomadura oligospora]
MIDAFHDRWGETSFRPTGIGNWEQVSSWVRAEQYVLPPGTTEFTDRPQKETGLGPLKLQVFTRQTHNRAQYEISETAGTAANPFPVFRGTPTSMTFYNAAGIPGIPPGEIQERCRALMKEGRDFQVCRMIAADGSIRYHVKVPEGKPAAGLPTVDDLVGAFRDQWGQNRFQPTDATAWHQFSAWQRFRQIQFPPGTDEFTGTPVAATQLRPFEVRLMRRTVHGREEFTEDSTVVLEDGQARDDGFAFGRFRGTPDNWYFYTSPTEGVPLPGAEYQLNRKPITVSDGTFLVTRVITPVHQISYYVLRRVA